MKVREVAEILKAEIIFCPEKSEKDIKSACGCDIMSDVLAFVKNQCALLTGETGPDVVRTALKTGINSIIFVRGKKPESQTVELAKQNSIVLMTTNLRMFIACGLLFANGISGDPS